jgi:nitrate/nitrite transport system substrate-binding protein
MGMVSGKPDYLNLAKEVMMPEFYESAMKEIGYKHGGSDQKPETLFDGVTFDPADCETYATSFAINSVKT